MSKRDRASPWVSSDSPRGRSAVSSGDWPFSLERVSIRFSSARFLTEVPSEMNRRRRRPVEQSSMTREKEPFLPRRPRLIGKRFSQGGPSSRTLLRVWWA